MYGFVVFTKLSVVFLLCLAGIFLLSRGFGMPIPYLEYGALEAWNVLGGAVLLALGVAFAFFWKLAHGDAHPDHYRHQVDDHWVHRGFKSHSLH